jgi:enoyl-[acyl-carrier protein] reductase II
MAGQSVGMVKEEEAVAVIIQALMEQSEGALTRR